METAPERNDRIVLEKKMRRPKGAYVVRRGYQLPKERAEKYDHKERQAKDIAYSLAMRKRQVLEHQIQVEEKRRGHAMNEEQIKEFAGAFKEVKKKEMSVPKIM